MVPLRGFGCVTRALLICLGLGLSNLALGNDRFAFDRVSEKLLIQRASGKWEEVQPQQFATLLSKTNLTQQEADVRDEFARFMNITPQDLSDLAKELSGSQLPFIHFIELNKFLAQPGRKFQFERSAGGTNFLYIKRVVAGQEHWERVERGKVLDLMARIKKGNFDSPSQLLTADALLDFLVPPDQSGRNRIGVVESLLGPSSSSSSSRWVSDSDLMGSAVQQFSGVTAASQMSPFRGPSCSWGGGNWAAASSSSSSSAAAVASTSGAAWSGAPTVVSGPSPFQVVWSGTKNELYNQFQDPLTGVIRELHQGHDGNNNSSNPVMLENKARIFFLGQQTFHDMLGDPTYARERLEILKRNTPAMMPSQIQPSPVTPVLRENYMDYSNSFGTYRPDPSVSHTFVNFANNRLGGGWRGHGNVQEEQQAQQSPEFAAILAHFNPSRNVHSLHTRTAFQGDQESGKYAHAGSADPILITGMRFGLGQSDGGARSDVLNTRADYDPMKSGFVIKGTQAPRVNMLAMAAPELGKYKGQPYRKETVADLFENAFHGFQMVRQNDVANGKGTKITTGRWGAGAFGHNSYMSLAVQYMAARYAGVNDIEFVALDKNEHGNARQVFSLVDQIIQQAGSDVNQAVDLLHRDSLQYNWITH